MLVLLSSAYFAPIEYYCHLYAADAVIEERHEHYLKQTYRNRCLIATPTGPLPLTVPVERSGASHTPIGEVRLSDHGGWKRLHWQAIASAYESSPFFEYYEDDLRGAFFGEYEFLVDFNAALRDVCCELLGLHTPVTPSTHYINAASEYPEALDLRTAISPKKVAAAESGFMARPYYQVFQRRTGFLPNLSILDLLCNLGSEARLVLRDGLQVQTSCNN